MSDEIRYTAGEQARRIGLAARGCVRIVRGRSTGRVDNAFDRLEEEAADRTRRDAEALYALQDRARNELAAAKAQERTARGKDRTAARQARIDKERRANNVDRQVRRAGL